MIENEILRIWIAQGKNGKWKWCVGEQDNPKPMYISTASFKTAKYAEQNAKIILSGRNIPHTIVN